MPSQQASLMSTVEGGRTAAKPLANVHAVLYGKFVEIHKRLKELLESLGAKVTGEVSGTTTHLICDDNNFQSKRRQVKIAMEKYKNVLFVNSSWLTEVWNTKKAVRPENHLHDITMARQDIPHEADEQVGGRQQKDAKIKSGGSLKKKTKKPSTETLENHRARTLEYVKGMLPGYSVHGCYGAVLSQQDEKHNKAYYILILSNGSEYQTLTAWGGFGKGLRHKLLGDGTFEDAKREFKKKFKAQTKLAWEDKEKEPRQGEYVFREVVRGQSTEPDSD